MNKETWNECDFVGDIRKYDTTPKRPKETVENIDDYDMRREYGCRVHNVHSRLERQEM